MNPMQLVILTLIFVVVVVGFFGVAAWLRPNAARQRLQVLKADDAIPDPSLFSGDWLRWIAGAMQPISKLSTPDEGFEKSSLKLRFAHAGIRDAAAAPTFFGIKTLLTLVLPLSGFMLFVVTSWSPRGNSLLFALLMLAALGYYAPNIVLSTLVKARQREIFESFPDALDLMTVCMEAGLGTESAMLRVADDMQLKSPALAEEMHIVNLEFRAGVDRERALRNLALRTGVEEVDSFVTMINQAERFGTSIAASLRVHSEMLRTRRRQRAEEAAAKIALKLLFPLIFCTFPALMVVLIGPAGIQIYRVFMASATGMGGN